MHKYIYIYMYTMCIYKYNVVYIITYNIPMFGFPLWLCLEMGHGGLICLSSTLAAVSWR